MNTPHIRNGLGLGISCIVATLLLYFINIHLMLGLRLYVILGLYIFWMRRSVKETEINILHPSRNQELFKVSWLTFILGVTISMIFMHLFANYGDPSIITETKNLSKQSQAIMSEMLNISKQKQEEIASQPTYINPYGLRAFASLLPSYFVIPGAILAFAMSRIVRPILTDSSADKTPLL